MRKYLFFTLALLIAGLVCGAAFADGLRVSSLEGDVKVIAPGSDFPAACAAGANLASGATIVTGDAAYVDVAFDESGANIVRIKSGSVAVLNFDGPDKVELKSGEVFVSLETLPKGETFRIRTPYSVCGARGTAWSVKVSDGKTYVSVLRGRVFVRGISREGMPMEGELLLEKGCETIVRKFERPRKYTKISQESMGILEKENAPFVKASLADEKEKPASEEKSTGTEMAGTEVSAPVKPKVSLVGDEAPQTAPAEPETGEEKENPVTEEKAGENKEDAAGTSDEMSPADPLKSEEDAVKASSYDESEPVEKTAEKKDVTAEEEKKEDKTEEMLEEAPEDVTSSKPAAK